MLCSQVGREANLLSLLVACLQIFIWTNEHPNNSGEKQPECCKLRPLLIEELVFNGQGPDARITSLHFQPEVILPPSPCPPNPLLKSHKCCIGRKSHRELPADWRYYLLMYLPVDPQRRTSGWAAGRVSHCKLIGDPEQLTEHQGKGHDNW